MLKNLKDLNPGMICQTRSHGWYVVLCDQAGRMGLYNERGTWGRMDNANGMRFGINLEKEVIRVYGFPNTLPTLDQISEGIKFVYETRYNTSKLEKLWEVETEEVTELKSQLIDLAKTKDLIDAKLNGVVNKLREIDQ